ncbi:hypothetical protein LVJ94_48620 [Pendulispora rubella]|uniref:Uncharacterized protein n=1 Tax=Pendulispora rubella TaxID=2741070 RepID=A0ABZ2L1E7_9BACT
MNTLRNMPIVLHYEDDGHVVAECPILRGCRCKCATRVLALQMMERLITAALNEAPPSGVGEKYEVIHLAVARPTDDVARPPRSRRPKPERARIEIL